MLCVQHRRLLRQGSAKIDAQDPGSEQIAVEEGRDGLAGLRDLVVEMVDP